MIIIYKNHDNIKSVVGNDGKITKEISKKKQFIFLLLTLFNDIIIKIHVTINLVPERNVSKESLQKRF